MGSYITALVLLLALTSAIAIIIHRLVSKSLRELLNDILALPSAATFYERLFIIGLVLIAVGEAIDTSFNFDGDPQFMEYVWRGATGLSSVFSSLIMFILAYLFMVTLIILVLRRRHDQ